MLVSMRREYTAKINWILDNLLPPILRDSYFFMNPFFWFLFKEKRKYFMRFKEMSSEMTEDQYLELYKLLREKHIKRDTDLNDCCITKIIECIVGIKVLDIACGRGFLTNIISEKTNCQVTGIDIEPPFSKNNNSRLHFQRGTVEKINYDDKFFDTVICAHTLEHVQNMDIAIKELRRVAKKRLILVVPRQREYKYTFDLHLNFFPYA